LFLSHQPATLHRRLIRGMKNYVRLSTACRTAAAAAADDDDDDDDDDGDTADAGDVVVYYPM
jgi:hypothetical protein